MSTYKNSAITFLNLVTAGKIRDAFDTYTSPNFIHHNPHFKGDRESLMKAMEENHNAFPNKKYELKHAVEEGNLVITHGSVQLNQGGKIVVVIHILRFENDKVVELWDVGEEIPSDSPNENGMI